MAKLLINIICKTLFKIDTKINRWVDIEDNKEVYRENSTSYHIKAIVDIKTGPKIIISIDDRLINYINNIRRETLQT